MSLDKSRCMHVFSGILITSPSAATGSYLMLPSATELQQILFDVVEQAWGEAVSRPSHESRTNRERRKLSYDAWLKSVKDGGVEGNIQFVKADVEDAVEHDDDLADFWAFSVA